MVHTNHEHEKFFTMENLKSLGQDFLINYRTKKNNNTLFPVIIQKNLSVEETSSLVRICTGELIEDSLKDPKKFDIIVSTVRDRVSWFIFMKNKGILDENPDYLKSFLLTSVKHKDNHLFNKVIQIAEKKSSLREISCSQKRLHIDFISYYFENEEDYELRSDFLNTICGNNNDGVSWVYENIDHQTLNWNHYSSSHGSCLFRLLKMGNPPVPPVVGLLKSGGKIIIDNGADGKEISIQDFFAGSFTKLGLAHKMIQKEIISFNDNSLEKLFSETLATQTANTPKNKTRF